MKKIKELRFNTTEDVNVVHSYSIESKYLASFFCALHRSKMTVDSLKMEYTRCADNTYRHFGNVRVTFSFIGSVCVVPLRLFYLGQFYQDEIVNNEDLKYDLFIRRPKF